MERIQQATRTTPTTPNSRSEVTLQAALKPLFAVAGVQFSAELMDGFHSVLKDIDARIVKAAVEEHLRTSMERFLPAPAVLRQLSHKLKVKAWMMARQQAGDCRICRNTGLVTARARGDSRWFGMRCCCIHGEIGPQVRFDPASMETEESVRRALPPRSDVPLLTTDQMLSGIGNIPKPKEASRGKDR